MIGVIGGMGPYEGIDLIKKVLDMTKATSDQEHIPLSLISVPHLIEDRTAFLLGKSQTNPGIILSKIAMQLIEQGATIIGMPCNTAHSPSIIAEIKNRIPDKIIFINMIEKVVHYIINEYPKISKVGVLATCGTLKTRIYNDELELIASPFMADPKMLNRWGFVVYTNSVDEQEFIQRIGNYPLRTMLRSIYGVNNTDLIITKDVALKLLSSRDNDRIIREGRILIIIDPQN